MHFATLTALALAVIGATHAKPTIASYADLSAPIAHNDSLAGILRVIELDSVQGSAEANTTLRLSSGPLEGNVLQVFPATLFLCRAFGCFDCFAFDLSAFAHGVCLSANFAFNSVDIVQPSNFGLPFGVFVGPPGCNVFDQITSTNTCFDINVGPYTQIVLSP